jgi:hypothetical protein
VKRFINFLFIAGALVGVFYLIGLITPRNDTRVVIGRVDAVPRDVSKVLADFSSWTRWHPSIRSARERDPRDHQPVWAVDDEVFGPYEVQISQSDETRWVGTWEVEDERFNLRFEVRGYGDDRSQISVTLQRILSDPWRRAARLLYGKRMPPAKILEGLGGQLRSDVEFD